MAQMWTTGLANDKNKLFFLTGETNMNITNQVLAQILIWDHANAKIECLE